MDQQENKKISEKQTQGEIDKDIADLENKSTQPKKRSLMPKKFSYKKIRAHLNPLDDTTYPYPQNPDYIDWNLNFPQYFTNGNTTNMDIYVNTSTYPIEYNELIQQSPENTRNIDFLDVGCGFGGLLFALGQNFPEKLALGLEIRSKLVDYIGEKIRAFRVEQNKCHNISVLRTNAMRHFLQYFRRASVEKLFFGFPDPHFKAKNYRRRIVNTGFLSEYAYVLKKGGRIYCITDVPDLHEWHVEKITAHSQFKILSEQELKDDKAYELIFVSSEESQKVDRHNCPKYAVVAERI